MTFEEAKFYPPADVDPVPLEPGDLPSSYGKNRLVLLPVDPYLMFTYWELASGGPPTAGSRAVLRFHESPVSGGTEGSRPFDVDIELAAGNWYVHLWSPEKVYRADLGLRGEDGSFVILAQSNTVRTAPAGPVAPSDAAPPPPHEPAAEPVTGPVAEPVAQLAPIEVPPPKVDGAAVLQRRLTELFALRGELPPMPAPYYERALPLSLNIEFEGCAPLDAIPVDSSDDDAPDYLACDLAGLGELDLTQYCEERFTPGISSEGGPLGE
jgi:Domain of unknown function (DUF4912)